MGHRAARLLTALALTGAVVFTFAPSLGNGFVAYDDDVYVTSNPVVMRGLTAEGVAWAFRTGHAGNWHPLSWLSHMADVSLFGLDPSGHHLTSLLLHVLNTLLLLFLLDGLTGSLAVAGLAAALFGLHPTRVESVVWVAERKDVLSTVFLLLAINGYAAWARRGGRWRYGASVAAFALGLLAKPMVVSLPLLLLLLDFWPLGRRFVPRAELGRRLAEKAPFFALALAAGVVTLLVQRAGGALAMTENPFGVRVANAVVSCVAYLRQLVWPRDLAVFYPHPGASLTPRSVLVATAVVVVISWLALRLRSRRPWLFVGWGWFVLGLLPVLGLVQAGAQGHSDRYTYAPCVGLFLAVSWGLVRQARGSRARTLAAAVPAAAVLVGCVVLTRQQIAFWHDTEALFRHALAVTADNDVAHCGLGQELARQGKPAAAVPQYHEAIDIHPAYPQAWTGLGDALLLLGRWDMAAPAFAEALRLRPQDALALANLALVRLRQGELAEAERLYARAAERSPDWPEPWRGLGITRLLARRSGEALAPLARAAALAPRRADVRAYLEGARALAGGGATSGAAAVRRHLATLEARTSLLLFDRGDAAGAAAHLRTALAWDPTLAGAHQQLGVLLTREGRFAEALEQLETAVRLDPDSAEARNDLGYLLLVRGRPADAASEFREALRRRPDFAVAERNLQAARSRMAGHPERGAAADGSVKRP